MIDANTAAPAPHRKLRQHTRTYWQIPIVDRNRRIVGWTSENPKQTPGLYLRHAQAEALIGEHIVCGYVKISDQAAAVRAGAPEGWREPWRCVALISEKAAQGGQNEASVIEVQP
jgi:hypothetical protein